MRDPCMCAKLGAYSSRSHLVRLAARPRNAGPNEIGSWIVGGLQDFSADDVYCVYCHARAAGQCGLCGALCCGDCVELVMGLTRRRAVWVGCGAPGGRSQRMVRGGDRVVVGGAESYEARCRRCHVPRAEATTGELFQDAD